MLIFTTEGGAKLWHGRPRAVSADLPKQDCHPSILKTTRLRPDIVINSTFTQQLDCGGANNSTRKTKNEIS